jgi:hypothetical protein
VEVVSKNAEDRVAAALNAMEHSGYTLCFTPPNVRPTVRDYHYAYTHGEAVLQAAEVSVLLIPCGGKQGAARRQFNSRHVSAICRCVCRA